MVELEERDDINFGYNDYHQSLYYVISYNSWNYFDILDANKGMQVRLTIMNKWYEYILTITLEMVTNQKVDDRWIMKKN